MSMDKDIDLDEQYDKIYRYCYFKLHSREKAEDITQETFLRFFENNSYSDTGQVLQYLYSIARQLCVDEYRKPQTEALTDEIGTFFPEDNLLTTISLKMALSELDHEEQELLLLRFANEIPVTVICKIFNLSRFAVYRRISKILQKLQKKLGKEDFQ